MPRLACLLGAALLIAEATGGEPQNVAPPPDSTRFVSANLEFTLLHELGHMLISELDLPVLGREEDAADQFAVAGMFLLHPRHDAEFYARLMDIADYWRLEWQRAESTTANVWDSHPLDAQRFYNIACLTYGSDPERLGWVLEASGLPVQRALYCQEEYQQVEHALQWVIRHFPAPESPPHRIRVIREHPLASHGDPAIPLDELSRSGELEALASALSERFALPRDLTLRLAGCGLPDATFNRLSGELALCYELAEYFRQLSGQRPGLPAPVADERPLRPHPAAVR